MRRFAPLIPQGEVLDLACGSGRHSVLLASMGYSVVALDRDPDPLSRLDDKRITAMQFDLENGSGGDMPVWPFEANRFSGIVVTNYLHRPLLPHIVTSLASNGVLIYETFAQGNEHFGKPSNPDFLLGTGELLTFAKVNSLRVIAFEDGVVNSPKPA
ncbi:MAG: class I SAM-dependent methyltransferase, partial [Burkholderiaceae bacterium]